MKWFFCFGLILAAKFAHAGDASIPAIDYFRGGAVTIPLLSQEECVARLPKLLAELDGQVKSVIANGMQSLTEANQPQKTSCYAEIFSVFASDRAAKSEGLPFPPVADNDWAPEYSAYYYNPYAIPALKAFNMVQCYSNGSAPGIDCHGKPFTSSDQAKAQAALRSANKSYKSVAPQYEKDFARHKDLRYGLPAEYIKLQDYPETMALYAKNREKVYRIVEKLRCVRRQRADAAKENACAGHWLDPKEEKKTLSQLAAIYPNSEKVLPQIEKQHAVYVQELNEHLREAGAASAADYESKRILTHFDWFISTGGKAADTKKFCREFEALQFKDKKFADAGNKIDVYFYPKYWKYAAKYGLSEAEVTSIADYTGGGYRNINPPLQKHEPLSPRQILYRDTLNLALEKLPSYQGTVVRFIGLSPESPIVAKHQVGAVVPYDAFTSTSSDLNFKFTGEGVKLEIKACKAGKDISELSANPHEHEVLFPAGTQFSVESRNEVTLPFNSKGLVIGLKEKGCD